MTRKLVVAMVIIGFGLSFLATFFLGFFLATQAQKTVEQTKKANQAVVVTNAKIQADVAAGKMTEEQAKTALAKPTPITSEMRFAWLITTTIVGGFCCGLIVLAAIMVLRRDESLPMTWAEAIVYTGIVFWFLIVINGIIPHYMIQIWDGWLQPTANLKDPMVVWPTKYVAEFWHSVTGAKTEAIGWQWAWVTVRDIIVAGWYVVTLVATVAGFWWAQEFIKRGKTAQVAVEGKALKSPYGRPMLVTGK